MLATKDGHGIGTYQCFCHSFMEFPMNDKICAMFKFDYDTSHYMITPLISIVTLVLNLIITKVMITMVKKIGYKT